MLKIPVFSSLLSRVSSLGLPRAARASERDSRARQTPDPLALFRDVRISRNRRSKKTFLDIACDAPWQIYAAHAPNRFDFSRPLASGQEAGTFPLPVNEGERCFFSVRVHGHTLLLAEEHLPLTGCYNFRDLGGIPTRDGSVTAWGRLFRSDSLEHLTPEDMTYLTSIRLVSVVDFRIEERTTRFPDRIPPSVKHHLHMPLAPGSLDPGDTSSCRTARGWEEFMKEINRELVLEEKHSSVFRRLFAHMTQERHLPLLFHCSAGKDRTGLAAAYVLFAVGVDKDLVMANYMDSAALLAGKYDHIIEKVPDKAAAFTVKPEYLQSAIDAMEEKSGSVEAYLVDVLDMDIDKMRALFLQ